MSSKIKKNVATVIAMTLCVLVMGKGSLMGVQAATDKPNLSIQISDAPVIIKDTSADTITASYNSKNYKVSIDQTSKENWTVNVSVLNSNTNKSVTLYIPEKEYDSVIIGVDNGMYSGGIFKASSITANVDNGGLDFSLNREFSGNVDIDAYNSVFDIHSLDDYKNFNVTMTCDSDSLGAAPDYYNCDYVNGKFTYSNGSKSNVMNISLRGGSVGSIE